MVIGAGVYYGGRYLFSLEGRYQVAQKVFSGNPSRVKPVLEAALARAARTLDLPPPFPQLICEPDSAGRSLCMSVVPLSPGVSTIQANAHFTREISGLGANPLFGREAIDGSVSLRYQAGPRVVLALELVPSRETGFDSLIVPAPGLAGVEVTARLALIIDDYGESAEASRRFETLPGTFTAAVRSNLDNADGWARQARQAGMEVILNLPLEPQNYPTTNPGPNAILVDLSGREIRKRVRAAIDRVGPVRGAKTYMGGLAAEDRDVIRPLLEELREKGMYLVDATQSSYSTIPELAREIGVQVFPTTRGTEVDEGRRGAGTIGIRFDALVKEVRARGYGIGIVHARAATLTVLGERLPELVREGIVVTPLSEVMAAYALE